MCSCNILPSVTTAAQTRYDEIRYDVAVTVALPARMRRQTRNIQQARSIDVVV
jgi:hypothetical protein